MTIRRGQVSFRQERRRLAPCPGCAGRGRTRSMFYELICPQCSGSGLADAETGEALPVDDALIQMRIRIDELRARVRTLERKLSASECHGPEADYQGNNGRGPGGSRWTGD